MKKFPPNDNLLSWLTLHLAPGFTSSCWHNMLANNLSPAQLCAHSDKQLAHFNLKPQTIHAILHPDQQKLEQIIQWLSHPTHHLLTLDDEHYPALLSAITDPPPLLYIKGDRMVLNQPQIAIVGSRNPTHTGLEITKHFTQGLADAHYTITSGLATGIDSAAHQAALNSTTPTVAVLGSGVEVIYPKANTTLAAKIQENGAIVSEFPPFSPPKRYQFPRRNRIISGLCLGTLVIEATQKSGSLITARLAGEQGREVFAIPGSILNPRAAGCLTLIQQGAKLTACVANILEELSFCHAPPPSKMTLLKTNKSKLAKDEIKLLESIGFEVTCFEQIVRRTGFTAQKVSTILCNLKLNGYIREEMGGYTQERVGLT